MTRKQNVKDKVIFLDSLRNKTIGELSIFWTKTQMSKSLIG
nr:hypothetical protein [Wolbachia endosymbiont of Spodoptera picta]